MELKMVLHAKKRKLRATFFKWTETWAEIWRHQTRNWVCQTCSSKVTRTDTCRGQV